MTLSGLVKGEQDPLLPIFNLPDCVGQSSDDDDCMATLRYLKMQRYLQLAKQCGIFWDNRIACSVAGDFNNCMLIRLDVNESELESLTEQCRQLSLELQNFF